MMRNNDRDSVQNAMRPMRLKIIIPSILLICIMPLAWMLFVPDGSPGKHLFHVTPGKGGLALFAEIEKRGIGNGWLSFRIALGINGLLHGPVKPGYYEIETPVSAFSLASDLCRGNLATLTVPEGLTRREISLLVAKRLGLEGDPFLARLSSGDPDYEGMLFPATYPLNSKDPKVLIEKLLKTFRDRTSKLKPTRDEIILASIIQLEGARVSEFPRISGVFHNRLKLNMPLESDPVLQYVVGKRRLTREILESRSPYNSYRYRGLPPGPICNPGMAALLAARNPERHDFLYFVSRRDGTHYFSRTEKEHFRAVGFYQLGYKNGFVPSPQ